MARLNLGVFGYRFKSDDRWIEYKSAYGRSARILKSDIESVSLDESKRGKVKVQVLGRGTTLASFELPKSWGYKVQDFILQQIGK